MNQRKFIHYVLLRMTNIALKAFLVSLAALAFGGIAFFILMMITGQVDYSGQFGIYG